MSNESSIIPLAINFDEASRCWRQNKIEVGDGSFVYRCTHQYRNKTICRKASIATSPSAIHVCKQHKSFFEKTLH